MYPSQAPKSRAVSILGTVAAWAVHAAECVGDKAICCIAKRDATAAVVASFTRTIAAAVVSHVSPSTAAAAAGSSIRTLHPMGHRLADGG